MLAEATSDLPSLLPRNMDSFMGQCRELHKAHFCDSTSFPLLWTNVDDIHVSLPGAGLETRVSFLCALLATPGPLQGRHVVRSTADRTLGVLLGPESLG